VKTLLKNAREAAGMTTRELSERAGIDQALISKFENGFRSPTRDQVISLADMLGIDKTAILTLWLKEKILRLTGKDRIAVAALKAAMAELGAETTEVPEQFSKLLDEMESLKAILQKKS
jgi:transcriptional regulator with XRE-family HTH domain